MFTVRLAIPPKSSSIDQAVLDTTFGTTTAAMFLSQLEDLQVHSSDPFSLEFYAKDNCVYLCICGEKKTVEEIVKNIYGYLGDIEVYESYDHTEEVTDKTLIAGADLALELPDIYPLQNYKPYAWDSLTPVLTALGRIPESDTALVQVLARPIPESLYFQINRYAWCILDRGLRLFRPRQWFRISGPNDSDKKISEKALMPHFYVNYRISSRTELPQTFSNAELKQARARLKNNITMIANAAKSLNTTHENRFKLLPISFGSAISRRIRERRFVSPFRAAAIELTTMWHPPSLGALPNTMRVLSRKFSAPRVLPVTKGDPQISFYGRTNYRDHHEDFGIRRFDRRRHLYLLGKSGTGKSSLIQLLMKSDIEQGYGCALLDPHGDLVDDVLRFIPKHRVNDVVIFDPSDINHPPTFNPMIPLKPELRMRVALGFLDTFKRVIGDSWSEKMDYVLRYSMIALLNVPGTSVVSLRRLLSDDEFRQAVVRRSNDEAVRRFWEVEFPANRGELEAGPISQLLNKLDELLATDMIRNILGQPSNSFDFREFIDSRKIVLCKVSKGVLGAENSALLGSLIIWKIYEAAMSRADQAVDARQDFYVYIDEFQNFATSSFGEILSESRKYRLCLTFANQFLGQLPGGVSDTVFGNVGNIISFRVGAEDAGSVANELKPRVSAEDLINLGLRQFYTKIGVDGEVQEAFSGVTLELQRPALKDTFVKECLDHSRRQYSLPIEQAEEQLALSEIMSPRAIGS